MDQSNRNLQKQYNKLMSKHDIERANARKAQEVAAKRSIKKAAIKRTMTKTVKAAATAGAVSAGVYATNRYLNRHQVTLNGEKIVLSSQKVRDIAGVAKKFKDFMGYIY